MGTTKEILLRSRSTIKKEENNKPISLKKWRNLKRKSLGKRR